MKRAAVLRVAAVRKPTSLLVVEADRQERCIGVLGGRRFAARL